MNTNIMRSVLSAYIFDKKTFELRGLESKHFLSSSPFCAIFTALEILHKKGLDFDSDLIVIEMEKGGVANAETVLLDVVAMTPISNIKHYESIIIEDWQSDILKTEILKILNIENLTSAERSAKIMQLQEYFKRADSTEPVIKIYDSEKVLPSSPHFYLKNEFPIQKNEIGLLTGPGGMGKSFVILWLASMLEAEEDLKIFAFLSEDSIGVTRKRLDTIKKANIKIKNSFPKIAGKDSRPRPFLTRSKEGSFEASTYFYTFKNMVKDFDVIILDPMVGFIFEDENNNVEAKAMLGLLNHWIEEEDKTLIIVHHHSKKGESRGASATIDAVRMHYIIKMDDNDDTKRIVNIEKTNHFAGGKEYRVRLFSKSFQIIYEDPAGNTVDVDYREV